MSIKTNRRSFLAGAGAVGAGLGMLASGNSMASTPKRGGTFRIGTSDYSSHDSLDPELSDTRFAMNLQWQVRNCLVEIGPGGVLVPELASEWSSSADLKTWTFKIRRGVEFHNGKSLTAADVVYSINLHRHEKTKSAAKALLTGMVSIKAKGSHEVVIELSDGNSGFASIMSIFALTIVQENDQDVNAGIGTGGYILESLEPGVRSLVKRNPNYWKEGRAHFDEVEIHCIKDVTARATALQTGALDAINFVDPATASLLKRVPGVDVVRTKGKMHYVFAMRTDTAPFADVRVREALKYAIDRQEILDKILDGYGSLGNDHPLSPAYEFFNTELPQREYNPQRAKALLQEAGLESLDVKLHVSETPFTGAVDAAQLFREQAARAGINIEVVREPDDGYWSNVWGKEGFFASRWSGRVNEDVMFSTPYSKAAVASGWNSTKWDNDAFNHTLEAARAESDPVKRGAYYWQCQEILHDDGGVIIPVFADFIDAKSSKVEHGDLSSAWDLDGARCAERWWFS